MYKDEGPDSSGPRVGVRLRQGQTDRGVEAGTDRQWPGSR